MRYPLGPKVKIGNPDGIGGHGRKFLAHQPSTEVTLCVPNCF